MAICFTYEHVDDKFMNMAKANWFFHKYGHVKLFCPWTWPRKIVQFLNAATQSCFVHERGQGKLCAKAAILATQELYL
jgi:hypothetical protein